MNWMTPPSARSRYCLMPTNTMLSATSMTMYVSSMLGAVWACAEMEVMYRIMGMPTIRPAMIP